MARLRGYIDDVVTEIQVDDTTDLPTNGGVLDVETEKISYTYATDKAVFGCTRGYDGTTPATHDDGTLVTPEDTVKPLYSIQEYSGSGAPIDNQTGVKYAVKGTRYTDLDTAAMYVNVSDENTPTWEPFAEGAAGGASGPNGAVQLSDGSGNFINDPMFVWRDSDNTLRLGIDTEGVALSITATSGGYLYFADENVTSSYQRIVGNGPGGSLLLKNQQSGQPIDFEVEGASFSMETDGSFHAPQLHSGLLFDQSGNEIMNINNMELYDETLKIASSWSTAGGRKLYATDESVQLNWSTPGTVEVDAILTVIKDDFGALYVHNVANDKAFRVDAVNGWSVLTDSIGDTAVTLGATPPNGQTPVGLDVQTHVDSGITLRENGALDSGWTLRRDITSAYGEFILGLADNTIEWEFHQDGTTLFPGNRFSLQNTGPGTILDLNASNASFIDFNSDDTLTNYATITAGGDTGGDLLIKSTLNRLGLWSNGFAAYIDGGITDATSWTLDAGGNNLQFKTVNATMYLEAGNQGVRVPVGTGNPSDTVAGSIYFNTSTNHFFGYDGSTWKQLDN